MNAMKIDEILSGQAAQVSKKSEDVGKAGTDDAFALLLQNEIAGQEQETAPNEVAGSSDAISSLPGVQSETSDSADSHDLSQAISALDGVLTQFDSLQNALQTTASPKEIGALIGQLNTQTASLDDSMSSLPEDHQLRDLAEEVKVTAYMESLKWKRGDYL
jgi:hypothetical protein